MTTTELTDEMTTCEYCGVASVLYDDATGMTDCPMGTFCRECHSPCRNCS